MNSMTGFGAGSAPLNGSTLRVEISGVNRKQTEIAINIPRAWGELETRVRELISSAVSRGRINVLISLQANKEAPAAFTLQHDKLTALQAQLGEAESVLGRKVETSLESLIRLGIISEETESDISAEEAWEAIEPALQQALQAFLQLRAQEGSNLRQDLLSRIAALHIYREDIIARSTGVAQRHKEVLLKRLEESGLPLPADDERIIKEIALYADRCDISEETTRLASHLEQFANICDKQEAVGRTLDFMCQEIFRELNTTGSKANDAVLAQIVVAAKTELEKIREQVQNVE